MGTRASAGSGAQPAAASGPGSWLLWSALLLAFSPVALDLARHAQAQPWTLYVLVFPLLFVRCALRDGRGPASALGGLWIAAGLALEIACVFLGAIRWARPGAALAAIGMCQRLGVASWRSRLLLLFAVPLPSFVVRLGERRVASALAESAAALWGTVGSEALLVGSALEIGGETAVTIDRAWLALAALLAGLAWYEGALSRRPLLRVLLAAAGAAALALPIHVTALTAALALSDSGAPAAAQALVDGLWLVVASAGVVLVEWRVRAVGSAP